MEEAELDQLARVLEGVGCPAGKSRLMASQLEKRARQLMSERNWSHSQALSHLLNLMRQGWASPDSNSYGSTSSN